MGVQVFLELAHKGVVDGHPDVVVWVFLLAVVPEVVTQEPDGHRNGVLGAALEFSGVADLEEGLALHPHALVEADSDVALGWQLTFGL